MTKLDPAFVARPIAHRGRHGGDLVENSTGAFAAAIAQGFGIELDVQASRDGVPMVFHDDRLDRLTEASGPTCDALARDLKNLRLKGSVETIPTLEEVLEQVAGQVPLLVEIKDQDGKLGRNTGGLTKAVGALLEQYNGPLAAMSFNPHHVEGLACARGLVTCAFNPHNWPGVPSDRLAGLAGILDADAVGASFVSHDWRDLGRPRVAALKDQGLDVLCWTIRSAKDEQKARQLAQNITFEGYDPG